MQRSPNVLLASRNSQIKHLPSSSEVQKDIKIPFSYRLRDFILATIALVILSPFMVVISLLLYWSQDNIFFIQQRPGKLEKAFSLYKFATLRPVVLKDGSYGMTPTRYGSFLRKYSLDELPQLFNVLKGDMALIGPRPLLMEYLPLYTERERERHLIRPGISGWAQIHGRNGISFKEKFSLDLWYLENRTHRLDLMIMFKTLGKVFRQEHVNAHAFKASDKYNGNN